MRTMEEAHQTINSSETPNITTYISQFSASNTEQVVIDLIGDISDNESTTWTTHDCGNSHY